MKAIIELTYSGMMTLFDALINIAYADTLSERLEILDKIRDVVFKSVVRFEGEDKK